MQSPTRVGGGVAYEPPGQAEAFLGSERPPGSVRVDCITLNLIENGPFPWSVLAIFTCSVQ